MVIVVAIFVQNSSFPGLVCSLNCMQPRMYIVDVYPAHFMHVHEVIVINKSSYLSYYMSPR